MSKRINVEIVVREEKGTSAKDLASSVLTIIRPHAEKISEPLKEDMPEKTLRDEYLGNSEGGYHFDIRCDMGENSTPTSGAMALYPLGWEVDLEGLKEDLESEHDVLYFGCPQDRGEE